jgi:hypothetical protein
MSSHRRMADDLSRMAAHFQSATQPFPPPPPPPPPHPQTTGQGRAGGEASTSNHATMWSFMGSSNDAQGGGGRWVSESRSESWINGQRQTTHKRRDANVCFLILDVSLLFFLFPTLPLCFLASNLVRFLSSIAPLPPCPSSLLPFFRFTQ